jgi:uncharacterized protein (UPF0212 family)
VTALERLVKAVESHKEAGFPPCPECDEAVQQAHVALVGLVHAHQMKEIEYNESAAALLMRNVFIRDAKGSS